ncbi:hypothetical protein FRB97_005877 [Tulasnella sp. 331]|nr:hypothetical protein FRB97_005877 [Tulasnella sp. 331]
MDNTETPIETQWIHYRTKSTHYIGTSRWIASRIQKQLWLLAPLLVLATFVLYHSSDLNVDVRIRWQPEPQETPPPVLGPYDVSRSVLGPPTASFRDNLRPNLTYITSFVGGGYTNDFMAYVNIVLLAQLTRRIAIIPPFSPSHIGYGEINIPFGEVFDVPRLAEALHTPVLEWRDVKKDIGLAAGPMSDKLGCWSSWAPMETEGPRAGMGRFNMLEDRLGLDISYTAVPGSCKMPGGHPHVWTWQLATLGFHSGWLSGTQENQPMKSERQSGHRTAPDEQLLCFDLLYYMGTVKPFEWDEEYHPGWQIASKMHFAPRMVQIANSFLMRLFDVQREEYIPPFISIHVRHGDFGDHCDRVKIPKLDCFAPLSVIARRVQEVQDELAGTRPDFNGGEPLKVLMTSDEQDPAWWGDVRNRGWYFVDHGPHGEDTAAKFGKCIGLDKWNRYPPLLDSVFQSMGTGFVGTDGSTMSLIARRRVQDWQGGSVRDFRWGHPGADDH